MKSHKDLVLEVQFCEINAVNFENKNILNAFLRMMDKCLQKSQQSLKHAGRLRRVGSMWWRAVDIWNDLGSRSRMEWRMEFTMINESSNNKTVRIPHLDIEMSGVKFFKYCLVWISLTPLFLLYWNFHQPFWKSPILPIKYICPLTPYLIKQLKIAI